jgi:four helix bundle protein
MPLHHEKLIVYQRSLEFAAWSQILIDSLTKKTSTRDHLERAGDSIALNIAEGNGKFSHKDRARFFQMAHGSALESAACLDLFVARRCCEPNAIAEGKPILEEIVKMLFAMLDQLGCRIAEDSLPYGEISDEAVEEEEVKSWL